MAASALLLALVAVMCESILVGAYAVLVALVLWLMITKSRRHMPLSHIVVFCASILMFLIACVHLGLVIQQFATPTLIKANTQAKIVLSVFQFVIGDLILIWRVWVVWGRNYFVPLIPFVIMAVAAGLQFRVATLQEIRSFFNIGPSALIVANTCICTLLIVGRIWYSRYQLSMLSNGAVHAPHFSGTVALFIESGALYAAIQIISLVLNHVGSEGIHIVLDLEIPLIGILPTLIIVFVHFELTARNTTPQSWAKNGSLAIPANRPIFRDRNQLDLETFVASSEAGTVTDGDHKVPRAQLLRGNDHSVV